MSFRAMAMMTTKGDMSLQFTLMWGHRRGISRDRDRLQRFPA